MAYALLMDAKARTRRLTEALIALSRSSRLDLIHNSYVADSKSGIDIELATGSLLIIS